MEDGLQGRVHMVDPMVGGHALVDGTVGYLRDAYGHILAVEVARANDEVVIPWRNVAAVMTVPSGATVQRGEDVAQLRQEVATSAGRDRA